MQEDSSVDEIDELETFLRDVLAGAHPKQRRGPLRYPQQFLNVLNGFYGTPNQIALSVGSVVALIVAIVLCTKFCSAGSKTKED